MKERVYIQVYTHTKIYSQLVKHIAKNSLQVECYMKHVKSELDHEGEGQST